MAHISAFNLCDNLTKVVYPRSVVDFGGEEFGAFQSDATTYYCYKDSAAHKCFEEKGARYAFIGEGRKKGDYNGDGVIGIDDLSVIKKKMINLINLTGEDFNVMDVNSDGVINLNDLTAMKRHMLNVKKLW